MSEVKNCNSMSWEEWSSELVRLAGDLYGPRGPIVECGEECWRLFFEDDYSPQDALAEDMSYA